MKSIRSRSLSSASCAAALAAAFSLSAPAFGQVNSVFTRTGNVTAQPNDYTCAQVMNCGPTNSANSWTGQNKFDLNGTSTTAPSNYPVIHDTFAGGVVGPRNSTSLQIVGTPNNAGDAEVNGVDAFAYNGELQYDAERWDRGSALANGSTSTSSPTLHVVAIPTTLNAGTTILDNGLTIGTVASTTTYGSTTITLTANAAHPVSSGDTLAYLGPGNAAVQNGEGVGCYTFEPFDGSSDSNTAEVCATATETQVHGTNNGTSLIFAYTPNASSGNLRYAGIGISPGGLGGVTVGDKGYQVMPTDLGKGTLNVVSDIMSGGHYRAGGTTPTLSGCPSGAVITGTDNAGWVYFGSGGASCTVTFAKAWASNPVCIVQNYANTSPVAYPDGVGTAQFSIKQSGTYTGNALYICQGDS